MVSFLLTLACATYGGSQDTDVRITSEQAEAAAWLFRSEPETYSPDWFARRYGVAPPALQRQTLTAVSGTLRAIYLLPSSADDRRLLWAGLSRDRTPNQSVARKAGWLIWLLTPLEPLRAKALELSRPDEVAVSSTGLEGLTEELPREIPGLTFYREQFMDMLPPLEARVGVSLRGVYQVAHQIRANVGIGRRLAQVEYWIPRAPRESSVLVRRLDAAKTDEQTLLSGKGMVLVLLTRTDAATRILLPLLESKGYRAVSRIHSFGGGREAERKAP